MTEHLIKRAKKGDSDAFCRLMDEQTQTMYKIARSYLGNDEDAADADAAAKENQTRLTHDEVFARARGIIHEEI